MERLALWAITTLVIVIAVDLYVQCYARMP